MKKKCTKLVAYGTWRGERCRIVWENGMIDFIASSGPLELIKMAAKNCLSEDTIYGTYIPYPGDPIGALDSIYRAFTDNGDGEIERWDSVGPFPQLENDPDVIY